MGKVFADISMSLDGFITGPDDGPALPLGQEGERLHEWIYDLASWRERHGLEGGTSNRDSDIITEAFENAGAVLMGRRMFDLGEEPWGAEPPFHMPVFIVTHRARETEVREGGTTYNFVTDGLDSALQQAQAAAGGKDISVGGGAMLIQECLKAGLLDEIQVHLVPILLGGGRRLFDNLGTAPVELAVTRVIESPHVTHLRYRVIR